MRLGDGLTPHEADELQAKLDALEAREPGGAAYAYRPQGTLPTADDLPGPKPFTIAIAGDSDLIYVYGGEWISLRDVGAQLGDGKARGYADDLGTITDPHDGDYAMTNRNGDVAVYNAYDVYVYMGGEWVDTGYKGYYEDQFSFFTTWAGKHGDGWVTEDTGSLWLWDNYDGSPYSGWVEYSNWKLGVRAAVGPAPEASASFPVAVTSVEVAGDSWVAGFGATAPAYSYAARLAKLLGVALTNLGQSGGIASGLASEGGVAKILQTAATIPAPVVGPYFSKGGLKVAQVGYNDATALGMNAGTAAVVESALTAFYAALRAARHIPFNDSSVGNSGASAAPDQTLNMSTGYQYMTADGQWAQTTTDAAYAGDPITVLVPHFSVFPTTGVLTAILDPDGAATVLGTYDGPTIDGTLKAVERSGVGCLRIPRDAIPHGEHVVRLVASGLDGSNFATFGGAIIEGRAPLLLPLYKTGDPSLDEQVAWVNARIAAVAALFDDALTVDLAEVLGDPRFFADGAHPNDLGNARVAGALLAALPQILTAENCGEMN